MISEVWIFLRNGLPLWNKRLRGNTDSSFLLDDTLISGLLTASSNFTQEALGGKLKDLILENELIHQFPILDQSASIGVLIDRRVDIEKLDKILETADKKLTAEFEQYRKEDSRYDESDVDYQLFFQKVSPPILEKLVEDLRIFSEFMEKFHGDEFDQSQIALLQKLPELSSYLNMNKLGLIMRDITTNKTHLSQNYTEISPDIFDEFEEIVKKIEQSKFLFNEANLLQNITFMNFGHNCLGLFLIYKNLFIIVGKFDFDRKNKFEKIVKEIKKRLELVF